MDPSPCDPSTCLILVIDAAQLSVMADGAQLVGIPLGLWALFLAWRQLKKAANTSRVQVVLALDEQLGSLEDVRYAINHPSQGKPDYVRLRRYISVFERVGHALSLGEISEEQVDGFYGSRFAKLARYLLDSSEDKVRFIVFDRDTQGGKVPSEAWGDFFYLWKTLHRLDSKKTGKKWGVPSTSSST